MTTVKKTNAARQWQTFNVVGGVISRTETGQVEGMLELAPGVAFTFICDPGGARCKWLPEEPNFVPDESADTGRGNAARRAA
jgi:hypothetical protein